ncbi:helix-turn-helix domain-containing protein [Streptomyces sp. NPDC056948]|uniref:helix-turn-helix domain-containing protein n=1 Tax=Streptomyces sp. NPDC056948 TaxID=3345975 RepID=UPI00362544F0
MHWGVPLDPKPDWVHARCRVTGDRIREVRRRAGLSQLQLGERVGLDHKTIHRYETAQRAPSLNVPLADLVR